MKCSVEISRSVFNDDNGTKITVGPDKDGLGLLEIDGGDEYGRIVLDPAMAVLLGETITAAALDMERAS